MKIVFAVIVLAVTIISADVFGEFELKLANYSQSCQELSQVDPDLIENDVFVEDPKFMQFTSCITKSLNVVDAEGNFKEKNFMIILMDNANLVLEKCKAEGEKETGHGKRSFTYLRCLHYSVLKDVNFMKNVFD
ncbi:PREDICTED: uncharacterized protein LOC108563401 [Nicrophorus vespilloides]|uniref:Uncharacterized protein LOC108563401 n=1 Tax=Nicrophorus vespilloides TaxID=110193 RepID=A0ABM1MSK1_NICVS|nr:PREDICTED: uncharacterized protein LOC108563401 [Nicrophorus vespilloides]